MRSSANSLIFWGTVCSAFLGGLLQGPARARAQEGAAAAEGGRTGEAVKKDRDWGARLPLDVKGGPGKAAPAPPEAAPKTPAKDPAPMSIPLVQGYDSFGLNIPDLDESGKLRSVFVIGAVSRVDDRNVEIRDSFMETYKEDGSSDFSIDLPKATLDRFTRVLVAKVPVTIRRREFEVQGATMEFNTLTHEGGLGGPIRMVIYNGLGALGTSEGGASEAAPKSSSTSVSVGGKSVEIPAPGGAAAAPKGSAKEPRK
jgi:hypothetical protein